MYIKFFGGDVMDERPIRPRINISKSIFFSLLLTGIFIVLSRRGAAPSSVSSESDEADHYSVQGYSGDHHVYEIHDIYSNNDDTDRVRIVNDEDALLSLSYRYLHFTDKEKSLYHELTNAFRSHVDTYNFVGAYTSDEVKSMLNVFDLIDEYVAVTMKPVSYSLLQYDVTGMAFSIDISYDGTKELYDDIYESAMNEVSKILYQIQGMTQYEAEVYFHDYITRMCHYVESNNAHKACGVFLDKAAVCEGYSKAFKILCNRAGIPCDIVVGDTYNSVNSGGHSWNLVTLDDKYYHVDVTFDDNTDFHYYGDHGFLNVSSVCIAKDHVVDPVYGNVPSAYSTEYNYYYMNGYVAENESDIVSICVSQMDDFIAGNIQRIELLIPDDDLYEQFCEEISGESSDGGLVFRSIVQCMRDKGYNFEYLYHSVTGDHAVLIWFE